MKSKSISINTLNRIRILLTKHEIFEIELECTNAVKKNEISVSVPTSKCL